MVQVLYPYVSSGKTIALNRWTFVDKVIALLFNFMAAVTIHRDFGAKPMVLVF